MGSTCTRKPSLLLSVERMPSRWSGPSCLCDGEEAEAGDRGRFKSMHLAGHRGTQVPKPESLLPGLWCCFPLLLSPWDGNVFTPIYKLSRAPPAVHPGVKKCSIAFCDQTVYFVNPFQPFLRISWQFVFSRDIEVSFLRICYYHYDICHLYLKRYLSGLY